MKVAVIGASGGIGQPLSLLVKLRSRVKHLALADVSPLVKGVALDISHIPTAATVTAHTGDGANEAAVKDADIVLIPAGVPRKPGMSREDLITVNAGIVKKVAQACSKHARKAMFGVISNPVNSTVPLFVETLVRGGFSPEQAARSVFGVTTLDALRARAFIAATANLGDPAKVEVPVVGGHAGTTIVPLFSQTRPAAKGLTEEQLKKLTHDTQSGGTYVVEAKGGAGSATLSMAQAAAVWMDVVMDGLEGKPAQIYSYVRTSVFEGCDYFAANCHVGKGGVSKVDPIGAVTDFEKAKLEPVRDQLTASVKLGIELASRD